MRTEQFTNIFNLQITQMHAERFTCDLLKMRATSDWLQIGLLRKTYLRIEPRQRSLKNTQTNVLRYIAAGGRLGCTEYLSPLFFSP